MLRRQLSLAVFAAAALLGAGFAQTDVSRAHAVEHAAKGKDAGPKPPVPAPPPEFATNISAVNSPDGQPLSVRVVCYRIDARLNTSAKTLEAVETVEYRNLTGRPLSTFPFHLYLNAFRPQSTFAREFHRDDMAAVAGDTYPPEKTGGIEIRGISAEGYGDLMTSMRFTAPDDGNADDHTVMEVAVPQPVAPGSSIRFHIAFQDKFPLSVARNGYKRDFIMGGQWFPKIGVFWRGAWNCHQYHATTEFFADFATFYVNLTLPRRYVVGAGGIEIGEQANPDGTKTVRFLGEDIHDFAWAASPHFLTVDDSFRNSLGEVKLHALVLASHADRRGRYLAALKGSMEKFDEWYGPYPYKQMTLIDPEPGSEMGGMEYPTLITGGTSWWTPAWDYEDLEAIVVHEFGHQYWYGMVATNEFEEAWLDEGINSYSESKVMAALFGKRGSILNARTVHASDSELQRLLYLSEPDYDPIARKAWEFAGPLSYAAITYGKTSAALATLESLIGQETLRRALHIYFLRYRFTHPTGTDFLHTIEEISGRSDLEPYFDQAIYHAGVLDYSIESLDSSPRDWWKRSKGGPYQSSVVVRRRGDFVFPVTVEVAFADGSRERAHWDGRDRWTRLSWDKPSRALWAQVDPGQTIRLDIDFFNNSYSVQAHPAARFKLTNYCVTAQQLFAQWISFLL